MRHALQVRSTEMNQLANKVQILEDEKAEMEISLKGLKNKQEIRDLNANKVSLNLMPDCVNRQDKLRKNSNAL